MHSTIIIILLITFIVILFFFAGVGIKILVKKNGQFRRHCASRDPYTGESGGCQCATAKICTEKKRKTYQPLEVNSELLKEVGTLSDTE